MGIMSYLLGDSPGNSAHAGGHRIDPKTVLQPTDGQGPTPDNPGQFSSLRSVPVMEAPRYFSREEARAIEKLAKAREKGALYTKKTYEALQKLDAADTGVHIAHYRYQGNLAANEVKKLAANVTYANKLHGLRPRYAGLGLSLESADRKAGAKIQSMKEKIRQSMAS